MSTQNTNLFNNATFNGEQDFNPAYDHLLTRKGNAMKEVIRLDRDIRGVIGMRGLRGITRQQVIDSRATQAALESERAEYLIIITECEQGLIAIERKLGYRP